MARLGMPQDEHNYEVHSLDLIFMKFCLQKNSEAAYFMSLVVTKPVFGVFDQVRHKPGCAVTENV